PLEMANSYATLAAGGVRCDPIGVEIVIDRDQRRVPVTPRCSSVVSTPVASTVTSLLAGVVDHGTGTGARVPGHTIAGKTGTTQDFGSAWFVGYTPQLATSVWVGDPRGPAYPLIDVAGIDHVYGGSIPASIFSAAMRGELAGLPDVGLPGADPS